MRDQRIVKSEPCLEPSGTEATMSEQPCTDTIICQPCIGTIIKSSNCSKHPAMTLTVLRTPGNPIIAAIDAWTIVLGTWALSYLVNEVELPPHLSGAGHWQFLTNLSLAFTIVVLIIGFLSHVTRSAALFTLKNSLHPIALVLESVVTSVYWPLRLFFLQLLVKDPTRKMIPMTVDLCLHLVPVVALIIDYLLFMPKWTIGNGMALSTCGLLALLYWVLLKQMVDFENGGEYPYNFLNGDSEFIRVVIFQIVGLVGYGSFLIFKRIYDIIVHPEIEEEEAAKLKQQ